MSNDITKAKNFAQVAHGAQVYNDEVPYTVHLENVIRVLERFGVTDSEMLCAGWLHDVIEDTTKSYNDIKSRFGEEVAELVYAVTSELGRNRKERNAKTYPKIKAHPRATILKLADRIANVEYGQANGGKTEMYRAEFDEFYQALYVERPLAGCTDNAVESRMWKTLKQLLK